MSTNDTTTPSLSTLRPPAGSRHRKVRVGRGMGSKLGKTAGKGNKGGKYRSGYRLRRGFEGGQMPLQRRLPKVGFRSQISREVAEVRLHELTKVEGDTVDLLALKTANVVGHDIKRVKVIASGELARAMTVKGLGVTKGARAAIEAAGGKVEE